MSSFVSRDAKQLIYVRVRPFCGLNNIPPNAVAFEAPVASLFNHLLERPIGTLRLCPYLVLHSLSPSIAGFVSQTMRQLCLHIQGPAAIERVGNRIELLMVPLTHLHVAKGSRSGDIPRQRGEPTGTGSSDADEGEDVRLLDLFLGQDPAAERIDGIEPRHPPQPGDGVSERLQRELAEKSVLDELVAEGRPA